jgi:hypothetical protein
VAPKVTLTVRAKKDSSVTLELRQSSKPDNHLPDQKLVTKAFSLRAGVEADIALDEPVKVDVARYLSWCLLKNPDVEVRTSEFRVTGVLEMRHHSDQKPAHDIGVETFEIWSAERRPGGRNFACRIEPPIDLFGPANALTGVMRPTRSPNAWVAAATDKLPVLTLTWNHPVTFSRIELDFDTDFDHPLESVLMGHPERAVPFCVKRYRLLDGKDAVIHDSSENHQTHNIIRLSSPLTTSVLKLALLESWGPVPASLFAIRCYAA